MAHFDSSVYQEILIFYEKGDWENILNLQKKLENGILLWPKPDKTDLDFIGRAVKQLGLKGVVSIGCGSGLLEWLLKSTNDLIVTGLEVDSNYWKSRYAKKMFIPLKFPQDKEFFDIVKENNRALMFCYFNNAPAFHEYLGIYEGHCIIIIGPHQNGKFTKPEPFDEEIPSEWKLWSSKEIYGTGDFIAVYKKI